MQRTASTPTPVCDSRKEETARSSFVRNHEMMRIGNTADESKTMRRSIITSIINPEASTLNPEP